jgi:hypothetical protein
MEKGLRISQSARTTAQPSIGYAGPEEVVRACLQPKGQGIGRERKIFLTQADMGMEQLARQFAKGDRHARRDTIKYAETLGVDFLAPLSMSSIGMYG